MAFFKFRSGGQPGTDARSAAAAVAAAPAESVETMRRRARHRLLGAAVLVLLGVIGFPLLFDTQPRPLAVDIPIEIPDRAKAKPLAVPPAAPAATAPEAAARPEPPKPEAPKPEADRRVAQASPAPAGDMITENADGTVVGDPAKPEPRAEAKPERKPDPKPEAKPEAKPAAAPKPAAADDGARARALLEGSAAASAANAAKPSAAADADARYVVQVGAFADAAKAREVRQKLEKAGLKTYTNVAKTSDGERTRVRVGPFASRADADKAAGKIKDLALPAAVLTL